MTSEIHPLLVGGREVRTTRSFEVINPADERAIAQVAEADAAVVDRALEAAHKAFRPWSQAPLAERAGVMRRYADLLEENRGEILDLLIAETGKPADNAQYDFGMLVDCLRFFPEEAARLRQEVIPDPGGRFLHYTLRQPLGVVVGYLAWNFPLLNLGYKLGPVLASGCTTVIKPSRLTPLATLASARLLEQAGLPPGVVNVIASSDHAVTEPLLKSPLPSMVTMIGSTASGLELVGRASTNVKHFSLELGGNAPVVVYDDAEVEAAARKTVDLKFTNAGQVCVSPNRCFVHQAVYEAFLEAAAQRASAITLAGGGKGGQQMGPMITAAARDHCLQLVEQAVRDGAAVVCGGKRPETPPAGFFLEPTILRDVRTEMAVAREEIFGPVLPVIPFTDSEDVVGMANDTTYGLAAYVFTENLTRALRAAEAIEAGSVCVNEPHYAVHLPHGGLKQSGIGKDCSHYSLEEYLTVKRVSILKGASFKNRGGW